MNKTDQELTDYEIKALFGSEKPLLDEELNKQHSSTMNRARATVGQRDTIMFAFIKLWTVLADMLAPIFASFAKKSTMSSRPTQINNQTKK